MARFPYSHSPLWGAFAGFIVALGAPVGWLLLRLAGVEGGRVTVDFGAGPIVFNSLYFIYITMGTVVAFSLFGWALGLREARLAKANAQLAELAITDDLTGVLNRRELMRQLKVEMSRARRQKTPLGLLFLDIDFFKNLNDDYGHAAGDEVLAQLGGILRDEARAIDVVGRYGGEEFALVLPNTTEEEAFRMSERLRMRIDRTPFFSDGQSHKITVSVGMAAWSPARISLGTEDALLRHADRALYAAKARGRNQTIQASVLDEIVRTRTMSAGAGGSA